MGRKTRIVGALAAFSAAAWYFSPNTKPPSVTPAPIPAMVDISPPSEDQIRTERAIVAAKEKANREFAMAVVIARGLKQAMKNPASFQLEQALKMADGSLCFTYRATNSFNAIVPGHAVFSTDGLVTSDDKEKFARSWKRWCNGKSGNDISEIRKRL